MGGSRTGTVSALCAGRRNRPPWNDEGREDAGRTGNGTQLDHRAKAHRSGDCLRSVLRFRPWTSSLSPASGLTATPGTMDGGLRAVLRRTREGEERHLRGPADRTLAAVHAPARIGEHDPRRSGRLSNSDSSEARHADTVDGDAFEEHRLRAYPPFARRRSVHDQLLFGLAVAGSSEHLIDAALVVAVRARDVVLSHAPTIASAHPGPQSGNLLRMLGLPPFEGQFC